jgi:hypothetical protein
MNPAVAELLADLTQRGIELVPHGDRLKYRPRSALTPDLLERLKTHKGALLQILRPAEGSEWPNPTQPSQPQDPMHEADAEPLALGPDGWPAGSIEPPPPCPACGGLESWWNSFGERRCLHCAPPLAAIRLLDQTEQIRRRHGLPSPAGAAEMLAHFRQKTGYLTRRIA